MGRNRIDFELETAEKTTALGQHFATFLPRNSVLALYGELGAGKTTFAQGLALGLGIQEPIQSPTFTYLNLYEAKMPLYHFDLYRLKDSSDFLALGFEEYFEKEGIVAIEWPERITAILPLNTISIAFSHKKQGRSLTITSPFDLNLLHFSASWD